MTKASSSSKSTAAKGGGKARASTAAKRPSRSAPPPSRWHAFRSNADGHAGDVVGIVLVALGLLAALGIYADLTGPFGRAMKEASSYILGWGHLAVPAMLVAVGVVVLAEWGPDGYARRAGIGLALFVIAVTGLTSLSQQSPGLTAPVEQLQRAGGVVGSLASGPVQALLGTVGALIILVSLLVVSLLVLTSTSVREAISYATHGLTYVGNWGRQVGKWLFTLDPRSDDEDDELDKRAPAFNAYDQELDEEHDDLVEDIYEDEPDEPDEVNAEPDLDLAAIEREAHRPPVAAPITSAEQMAIDLGPRYQPGQWKLPPLSLLHRTTAREVDRQAVELRGRTLEEALRSHGVETRLVGMTVGPTVTRYELELGAGVKVARVTALHKDIAYAMAAEDVRILAPIPGRSAIGVEVPNRDRQLVSLGDVLATTEARAAEHPLEVGIGRDINGRAYMLNLAETPHILIAGATGAGKSSCINSMLTSMLMRSTPDQVRLILIDPKRVELGQYNGLPHLLTQVVVNPKRAANALQWAVREMERRYDLLAEVGVRDITGYNSSWDQGALPGAPGYGEDSPTGELAIVGLEVDDELAEELEDDEDGEYEIVDEDETDEEEEEVEDSDEYELVDEDETDEEDDEEEGDEEEEEEEVSDELGDEDADEEDEFVSPAVAAIRERKARVITAGAMGVSPEKTYDRLPFVVVVVDELNDLMMVAARDVEESICRIAQMARAVGIHLVIATQRPSVDVITGVIKANIPSRLAFAVSTLADSRVILDQPGAERLVGKGDMLLVTASSNVPRRIQGPWVGEDEVRKVVGFWRRQHGAQYVDGIEGDESGVGMVNGRGAANDDDDELLDSAIELVVRSQLGSTSMLQRKLRVGFARAGRLMDLLEQRGIVGPSEGSKARMVMMTPEELDAMHAARNN